MSENFNMSIPLSVDDTRHAYLTLPKDLNANEAARIGIIIRALVIETPSISLAEPTGEWAVPKKQPF